VRAELKAHVAEVKQNVAHLYIQVELWSEFKHGKLLDPNAPTRN
jgi:hypothetical protein